MAQKFKNVSDLMGGMKADYAAMTPSRFRRRRTGITPTGSGADYHYRNETQFLNMREHVRAMDRDDAIIGCSVDKVVQQHIQGGFRLDPQTGDKKLDVDLWEMFNAWANDPEQCDVTGEMTFTEMESLALRHTIIDGDVFALPLLGGQLQMVEADQCRTPGNTKRNVVLGVELDEQRQRQTYFFTKRHVDPWRPVERVGDMSQIAARDGETGERQVFHIFPAKRFSQTRGVTAFHAVFDIAGMWEDTNFALLVKQQIAACFGAFIERSGDYGSDMRMGERTTETLDDGNTTTIEGITPGMIMRGRKGEKLTTYSPNIPSNETMVHLRMLKQIIAVNLGIPYQLMMLDASETNFSGWRGAMDMARLGFRSNQMDLMRQYHRPVYRWKGMQWMAKDPAMASAAQRLGEKFFAHIWHRPSWPYIQPKDDADANVVRVQNFQASPRQIAAENGREFDDIIGETIADNAAAIRAAIVAAAEINKDAGVDAEGEPIEVTWRDVLNLTKEPASGRGEGAKGVGSGNGKKTLAAQQAAGSQAGMRLVDGKWVAEVQPLNGAQIGGAMDVLVKLREKTIGKAAATELLARLGIEQGKAEQIVKDTPIGLDNAAGDVAFKREILVALLGVPQAREVLYNGTDIEDLIKQTGLAPEKDYKAPFAAVVAPAGQLINGAVIRDKDNDVVGGDVKEVEKPAPAEKPVEKTAEAPAQQMTINLPKSGRRGSKLKINRDKDGRMIDADITDGGGDE